MLPEETFRKLRKLITKFLHQFMKPCIQFPLHEAFCYDQMRSLKEVTDPIQCNIWYGFNLILFLKAFTPQIQAVLRQSMVHPELYLGYLPPHRLPDTCMAYVFMNIT